MASCCESTQRPVSQTFRTALKWALAINLGMLLIEIVAGAVSGSVALMADALDFFGDSANYVISLFVLGLAPVWRSRAALWKGITLLVLGSGVLVYTLWGLTQGRMPEPITMGVIAVLACIANLVAAVILFRFRDGDANMQSVWLCSRNDAIGNLAVLAAALGVFGTGSPWPDLAVAGLMATLSLSAGLRIVSSAGKELRNERFRTSPSVTTER